MTNEVLSGDNQAPQDSAPDLLEVDPFEELVGEGKKFRTRSDLAKGKLEADRFIAQLQSENERMRQELRKSGDSENRQTTLTEILDEIRKASHNGDGNQSKVPSMEEILKVVDSRLTDREANQAKIANRAKSNAFLLNRFNGDAEAARKYMAEKAQTLRLPDNQLRALAETSPDAFVTLLGLEGKRKEAPANPPVQGVKNTEALNLGNDGERNRTYYAKLRKEMGMNKFYNNLPLQKQMSQDMDRLGEKFFE